MADIKTRIYELCVANRILAREGVVDAYGHVSIRHPDDPTRFLMSRSRSPELVAPPDVLKHGIDDSEPIGAPGIKPYSERFIHGAIYGLRPDVNAIVHHHAYPIIPFTVSQTPFRPVWHVAAGMGTTAPLWDIRDKFGDTNLLVLNMDQGRDLAEKLATNTIALMRGHGCVVVGAGLKEAVAISVYAMHNATALLDATRLGTPITYLSDGEVAEGTKMLYSSRMSMERAWEFFVSRADMSGL